MKKRLKYREQIISKHEELLAEREKNKAYHDSDEEVERWNGRHLGKAQKKDKTNEVEADGDDFFIEQSDAESL